MDYAAEIEAQQKAVQRARARLHKAETAVCAAEDSLERARTRLDELRILTEGKSPYLVGVPYEDIHHGDAYRTTVVSGINDEIRWWTADEAAAKKARPPYCAYIIALEQDCKTRKGLLYLDRDAKMTAGKLRELIKLPEID